VKRGTLKGFKVFFLVRLQAFREYGDAAISLTYSVLWGRAAIANSNGSGKCRKGALNRTSKGRSARATGMDKGELQDKVIGFRDAQDWEQFERRMSEDGRRRSEESEKPKSQINLNRWVDCI
jgi:hypothetical protein